MNRNTIQGWSIISNEGADQAQTEVEFKEEIQCRVTGSVTSHLTLAIRLDRC